MEAIIKDVKFTKEGTNKFGPFYSFKVSYDDKTAFYNSKKKDQNNFVTGQKAEFTEEERTYAKQDGTTGKYLIIKPVTQGRQSNFGKALKKEQSKYSGFADSYVKDLMASGIIRPEVTEDDITHNDIIMMTWKRRAYEVFEHMVELDKSLES